VTAEDAWIAKIRPASGSSLTVLNRDPASHQPVTLTSLRYRAQPSWHATARRVRRPAMIQRMSSTNTKATVAVVQASYVLMDREATLAKAEALVAEAPANGAGLVVLPEAFVPGTPIWIDTRPIWDGDAEWYALLVDQAVVIPGPATERLGKAAREAGVYLVVGVNERELHGATIYDTVLYFGPDGTLLGKHRKLVPTGSERTVWGMGDGSTIETYPTPLGRIGGLICWENFMPLARFFLYSQGVDIWIAPTLAAGDFWITALRYIAIEGGCSSSAPIRVCGSIKSRATSRTETAFWRPWSKTVPNGSSPVAR
jgi:predicted amidohydrolase